MYRLTVALAAAAVSLLLAGENALAGSRLRPPPDVRLHPDRGMTFTRYSRASHDQRLFKPLNQGTRLSVMDSAIDPYNLGAHASVYDPATGQVRGSLSDAHKVIRRAQDASRRTARSSREQSSNTASRSSSGASGSSRSTPSSTED